MKNTKVGKARKFCSGTPCASE